MLLRDLALNCYALSAMILHNIMQFQKNRKPGWLSMNSLARKLFILSLAINIIGLVGGILIIEKDFCCISGRKRTAPRPRKADKDKCL